MREKTPFTRPPTELELRRFWIMVDQGRLNECWMWLGALTHGNYGKCTYNGWKPYAHRFSWFIHFGPPDPALTIDHLCHDETCRLGIACPHRRCVNPYHLSQTDGVSNANRTGNLAKQYCRWGHRFDEVNSYIKKDGSRGCRLCNREQDRERSKIRWLKEKQEQTNTSVPIPKLTEEQRQEIRDLYAAGNVSQRELARRYQVSQPAIRYIIRKAGEKG